MKRFLQLIICIAFSSICNAQDANVEAQFSKYFKAEKKYLVLPVKNGATKRNIELWVEGVNTRYFDIELAEDNPDWFAFLSIEQWEGKEIELRVLKLPKNSKVFNRINQQDDDGNSNNYHESSRAQFHFSPKRGWTNDPNGMVYYKGEYHLFFQHNPYGRDWGNMTWGHAVSKDLIHWKELDDALHPDHGGPVFSGGAVVDSNNTSGLGTTSDPPMVMFHTGARGWGQYLSWSNDGRQFKTLEKAVVPRINKDNRDPKVIWHAPSKKWIMVLWVERGDNEQHSMQFLSSLDLKSWTETSMVMGGIGNDRYLFECPEFYELEVQGNPNLKKWILTGANTEYAIGSFDGVNFTPDQERLQGQFGRDFYAPQTFSDQPQGRRIEIGWWRTNTAIGKNSFNQSMSVPLEQKLVQTDKGLRLTRMPVKELEMLRGKAYVFKSKSIKPNQANLLKDINLELAELRCEIEIGKAKQIDFTIRGVTVHYDVVKKVLIVDGVTAPLEPIKGRIKLIILADRTGLEIFGNDGLLFMPININLADSNRSLSLSVLGGNSKINSLELYELKSIW